MLLNYFSKYFFINLFLIKYLYKIFQIKNYENLKFLEKLKLNFGGVGVESRVRRLEWEILKKKQRNDFLTWLGFDSEKSKKNCTLTRGNP